MDIDDLRPRMRGHRERQDRLEAAESEAGAKKSTTDIFAGKSKCRPSARLGPRRKVPEQAETIATCAQDMRRLLKRAS